MSNPTIAREFEVLSRRAMRLGKFQLDEMLELYRALEPAAHPHLNNERRFDWSAIEDALARLPHAILDAREVHLVPRLDRFSYFSTPSPNVAAGFLEDGTLLIEARFGLASVMDTILAFCAIEHEKQKVSALLEERLEAFDPGGEEDVAHSDDETFYGDEDLPDENYAETYEDEPSSELVADMSLEPEATASDANDVDAEDYAEDYAEDEKDADDYADYDEEGDEDSDEAEVAPGPTIGQLALWLGLEEVALEGFIERSEGAGFAVVAPSFTLPELEIHEELKTENINLR
ncbi:hypothetical protein KAI87_06080, partial [Myxococcota bacterium]|nr:hypothetical protein [Myxococcota bacterium]